MPGRSGWGSALRPWAVPGAGPIPVRPLTPRAASRSSRRRSARSRARWWPSARSPPRTARSWASRSPAASARWDVDLGSRVAAGAVLAELDARDYELRRDRARAALEQARARLGLPVGGRRATTSIPSSVGIVRQAKARLDQATVNLDRSRELRDQGILAQAEFDASRGRLQGGAEPVQRRPRGGEQPPRHPGRAPQRPRAGRAAAHRHAPAARPSREPCSSARANLGEYLAAGRAGAHAGQADAAAPAAGRARARGPRTSARARRWRSARRARPTPGRAGSSASRPRIEEANRSLIVEAEVDNSQGLLRPGSFARAEILTESGGDSVVVPASVAGPVRRASRRW